MRASASPTARAGLSRFKASRDASKASARDTSKPLARDADKPFARDAKPFARDTGRTTPASRSSSEPPGDMARLFVGSGTDNGLRPADLVGAIANEVGVSAQVIGAIRISERYALVEVPETIAESVHTAQRATRIKGHKVVVRRDADEGPVSRRPTR